MWKSIHSQTTNTRGQSTNKRFYENLILWSTIAQKLKTDSLLTWTLNLTKAQKFKNSKLKLSKIFSHFLYVSFVAQLASAFDC